MQSCIHCSSLSAPCVASIIAVIIFVITKRFLCLLSSLHNIPLTTTQYLSLQHTMLFTTVSPQYSPHNNATHLPHPSQSTLPRLPPLGAPSPHDHNNVQHPLSTSLQGPPHTQHPSISLFAEKYKRFIPQGEVCPSPFFVEFQRCV